MAGMFGCIVSGRLVQTDAQVVDAGRLVFTIPGAESINHLAVFMTGLRAFDPGVAATIHSGWPKDGAVDWQLLGMLSNEKPSAIFRLTGLKPLGGGKGEPEDALGMEMDMPPSSNFGRGANLSCVAQVGISIEPVASVEAQMKRKAELASMQLAKSTPPLVVMEPTLVARRLLQHFWNHVSSYARGASDNPAMRIMQEWYSLVERKLRMDPGFLTRDN